MNLNLNITLFIKWIIQILTILACSQIKSSHTYPFQDKEKRVQRQALRQGRVPEVNQKLQEKDYAKVSFGR